MIKINYQDHKTFFKTTLPVLVTHLNYGNHLGYDALLTLIQDARIFWLKLYNMSEISVAESTGLIVKSLIVDYCAEAFHGDNLLIELYVSELKPSSFILVYKVSNLASQKVVALALTTQVFFNYNLRKVAKTPKCFIEAVLVSENNNNNGARTV